MVKYVMDIFLLSRFLLKAIQFLIPELFFFVLKLCCYQKPHTHHGQKKTFKNTVRVHAEHKKALVENLMVWKITAGKQPKLSN